MRHPIDFRTKLTPIRHAVLEDHHRVPVAFVDGKYEVYVGDRMVRMFDEDTLPDNIKAIVTMIRAGQTPPDPINPPLSTFTHAYDYPPDSNFYEIGWFVTDELFIIVLPTKDLANLKGNQHNELCLMEYRVYNRGDGRYVLAPTEPTFLFLEEFFWRRHQKLK